MDWTRDRARDTIDRVLKLAAGSECEVQLEASASSHTRFARNEITTSGHAEDLRLVVTLRREGRAGTVLTNDLSQDGLKEAVTRAEATRAVMPPDPEAVELLPTQEYPVIDKHDERAAAARAAERAPGVKAALREAGKRRLTAAGFFETGAAWRAIGNSTGNFGWHRETLTGFSATMRTGDGTGS
ncbi:MAG: PmbA/TldA family metallopeptidase, partial [Candidatus Polarisedimenticolia bacterium]